MQIFSRRKLTLFYLILFFFGNIAFSQSISVSFGPQYGAYDMEQLSELQNEERLTNIDTLGVFQIETVYDFPPHIGFRLNFDYGKNKHRFGTGLTFNSTGGRLSYADYSGIIQIDKLATCTALLLSYKNNLIAKTNFIISGGALIGGGFSKLKNSNMVQIYISDEVKNESKEYQSFDLLITPEISLSYFFFNSFYTEIYGGYALQVASSELKNSSTNEVLTLENSDPVQLQWSGYRVGVNIGYKINFKK